MAAVPLERHATDLFTATVPLRLVVGDIGARMTVVRLGGDLVLHSPVARDPALGAAVDALGTVRWIVGPSRVHHFYLAEWAQAFPQAELWGAPGLAAKKPELGFRGVLCGREDGGTDGDPFGDRLPHVLFEGAPLMNEVVFFHPPSRTLILTDLAFDRRGDPPDGARLFHLLSGARGRFGPHRIVRAGIRDRTAARRSLERILAWDFDRVVVSHGQVAASGGRALMESAFAFLR